MNERIKELAYTAKLDEHMLWTSDEGNKLPYEMIKFAELIVRECMACSTWVGKVNENVKEPGPMHTAHAINQRIKKHFGVEE
jgi:hypothetical protein